LQKEQKGQKDNQQKSLNKPEINIEKRILSKFSETMLKFKEKLLKRLGTGLKKRL